MNQLYIDGAWTGGAGGHTWTVTNPATGESLADVAVAAAEDVDRAVRAARRAFEDGPWPRLDPLVRGRMLYKIAERIRARLEDFAMTDTRNVGKPIRDTRGFDVPCAADLFESYAGLTDKIAGKCYGTLPDNVTMQFREPLGAIAAIVPWNFPLTNAAIKLAPVLACGNTVVLKPSEVSPLSALMLAELAHEIGFPPGVLNVLHGTGAETGTALVRHPGIDKISFTGRHQTGLQMLEAAKVGMKGVMLELGGKTPSVVFPDAPLEHVVNGARALRVARRLRAGRIAINGGGALRPNVPVFGYKLSGIGAELGFDEAVHEYTNSKAVLYSLATEKTTWPE